MLSARFRISESSQRGEPRRIASAQAQALGFDEARTGRVAVVVSELAGNLLKHVPGGGDLFVRSVHRGAAVCIDVVAVDRGPGIGDRQQALRDGYSTAGSAGTGLGAVARMSDAFDLYTSPESGTIIVSHIWRDGPPSEPTIAVGGICAPKHGERVAGDAYAVVDLDAQVRILVADGLGHGPDAEVAAAKAVRTFEQEKSSALAQVLETIHGALRSTRGAAVAIAEIDPSRQRLQYVGIGNISGAILGRDGTRNLVSHNGIVGHAIRRIQEFSYELPAGAVTILHSDGLKSRWSLDAYPGLLHRDPTLVAGVLLRDFERGRDDATAVVARV
jgi:anti-sigma regulatory factor (Ser/Thr protein kinase)